MVLLVSTLSSALLTLIYIELLCVDDENSEASITKVRTFPAAASASSAPQDSTRAGNLVIGLSGFKEGTSFNGNLRQVFRL